MSIDFVAELSNPHRFRAEFDRLHRKHGGTGRMHALTHANVTFRDLLLDSRWLSSAMAREIAHGRYALSPARVREVMLDQRRELFHFEALDFLVHGVTARLLTDAIEPLLSPRLYSYRTGRSSIQAVRDFARYVREHRAARPNPTARGLYVFRGDVRAYGDSIEVGATSALWPMLQAVLALDRSSPHWGLLEQMIRPEIIDEHGARSVRCRGLPLGSPITPPLLNLYLHDLDRELSSVTRAFYARFGDDLLFSHSDPRIVKDALTLLSDRLRARSLALHPGKRRCLFFNGASRRSAAWPDARATCAVLFLGFEVRFDGTVALPREKWRNLLSDVVGRVQRTEKLLRGATQSERGAALCAVVNECLDPCSIFANLHAERLRHLVTSREQLAEFDRLVAQTIAEALTGRRGPRAFREVPPRKLRNEWNLRSAVAVRNADG